MNSTRTDRAIVSYALYIYFSSRSFRLAAKSLVSIKRRCHLSICKWVKGYSSLAADKFGTDKRLVKMIFVDETLLQIDTCVLFITEDTHIAVNPKLIELK